LAEIIRPGSEIRFHFRVLLADGTLVDATDSDDPVTVTTGRGELMPGLEQRLLGLTAGDRRRFEIPAGEAYGAIDLDAITRLPRGDFPAELALEPGTLVAFTTPEGQEVPGTVISVEGDEVLVDFSHPFAGHDIVFEIEILTVGPQHGPVEGRAS
jgi:FKBP-type peptidyl-prolyl cis-trans isomerase SlpA